MRWVVNSQEVRLGEIAIDVPQSPFLDSARRLQPHPKWTAAQS